MALRLVANLLCNQNRHSVSDLPVSAAQVGLEVCTTASSFQISFKQRQYLKSTVNPSSVHQGDLGGGNEQVLPLSFDRRRHQG